MLETGMDAPGFSLPDQDGRLVTLDELVVSGPLILFFYPADFTPVCTRESCMFRDAYSDLAAAGVTVAGVSPDDTASHARFRVKHSLPYSLLADAGKQVIKAFGVDGPLGVGVRRATFLIDTDKRIRGAVRADLRLTPHREIIEQAINLAGQTRTATASAS